MSNKQTLPNHDGAAEMGDARTKTENKARRPEATPISLAGVAK